MAIWKYAENQTDLRSSIDSYLSINNILSPSNEKITRIGNGANEIPESIFTSPPLSLNLSDDSYEANKIPEYITSAVEQMKNNLNKQTGTNPNKNLNDLTQYTSKQLDKSGKDDIKHHFNKLLSTRSPVDSMMPMNMR